MISNASVEALMAQVPDEWFLKQYVNGMKDQVGAPLAYQLGAALAAMSLCAGPRMGFRYFASRTPTLFLCLVGKSGSGKSAALDFLDDVLSAAELTGEVLDDPGSNEAFIDLLASQESWYWNPSEGGSMLANTKNGYLAKMKPTLLKLWDGHSVSRVLTTKKPEDGEKDLGGIKICQPQPRFTFVLPVAPDLLTRHTTYDDWRGGFMGRFLFISGEELKRDPIPKAKAQASAAVIALATRLVDVRSSAQPESYVGNITDTGNTRDVFRAWTEQQTAGFAIHGMDGINQRIATQCFRIAALLQWFEECHAHAGDWQIESKYLYVAARIVEMHLTSLRAFATMVPRTDYERNRLTILECFPNVGDMARLAGILRKVKMSKKQGLDILMSLVAEETLSLDDGIYTRLL
jgi:hypothetical protein